MCESTEVFSEICTLSHLWLHFCEYKNNVGRLQTIYIMSYYMAVCGESFIKKVKVKLCQFNQRYSSTLGKDDPVFLF